MASSIAARRAAAPLATCPSDDLLLAFIPGELAPEEASSVSAHLETCPACQSRLTTLQQRSQRTATEPTSLPTPPERRSPALPVASGSDAPTTLLPQPRPRLPEQIGQYKLIKQIGRGGMGLVFLARHVRLGRTVAIKLLPGLRHSDKSAIVRLQREIAAAGRVQHENIVFATDANEEDGIDYLVMEHIAGIDVGRLVAALGPLPCPAACEIIRQAALGLAHIQACGLVHRDLKPSNLMLAADGVVKILDLGLAMLLEGRLGTDDSATQTGYLLGTADYVSPEQLHDPHDADVRSDLYSLGCTFYKLLTGQAPFGGSEHSSLAKKLDAHRFNAPPSIHALREDVPADVERLLARLLAKERSERIQDPAELAALLAPLAAGADLAGLYEQAGPHGDLDELPLPQPSATPRPDSSTHSQGKTPTPTNLALPNPRRRWLRAAVAAGVVLLILLGALAAFNLPPGEQSDGPQIAVTRPEPAPATPVSLLDAAVEIPLPGEKRPSNKFVDHRLQYIQGTADGMQLIKLGELTPGNYTIAAEFDLADQQCDAGFFFAHQEVLEQGQVQTAVHLVFLTTPIFIDKGPTPRLVHAEVRLGPPNEYPYWLGKAEVNLLENRQRLYRLEVALTEQGLASIKLAGQEQPILQSRLPRQINLTNVWGVWGIYHNGHLKSSILRVIRPTLTKVSPP